MTSSDETQDRELLERYRQASSAESLAPSDAVRAAILEEGRRTAASFSTPAVDELLHRRPSRWRMTAFATAACVLLAAVVIAPKLWELEHPGAMRDPLSNPFKQAAVHKAQSDAAEYASTPPVPVEPVPAVPPPKLENIMPSPGIADRQSALHPTPPIHYPEQSVEVGMLNQNRSLQQSRSAAAQTSASAFAERSYSPSGALLAAASAGDSAKVTLILNQRAAMVDERDSAGRTPLMLAVEQGRLETVRLLLERGADPNAADQTGLTPLKLAQQRGMSEIAEALKRAGERKP
jgi:Ankyrin repeats (3 copies)